MKSIYEQYRVTPEQVDSCQRYVDEQAGTVLYLVPSAHTDGLFYRVEWNRSYGRFSCTCLANANGLSCWHMRASLVHATLFAEMKRTEAEAEARIAGEQAQAMRVEYHCQHPAEYSEVEIREAVARNRPCGFSLLRGGE